MSRARSLPLPTCRPAAAAVLLVALASAGVAQAVPLTPGLPPPDGATDPAPVVGFGPTSGLSVEMPGGDARLELHFATWLRLEIDGSEGTETVPAFSVPLARPVLQGFFFQRRVEIFFQPELAGRRAQLLDAYAQLELSKAARLRLGQFRTPFSRAFVNPIITLQLPDRGRIDDAFRLGRDTGLMLFGTPLDRLEYAVGVFDGAVINDLTDDRPGPMLVARGVWTFGAPVPYDQSPAAARREVGTGLAVGLDAAFRDRGVAAGAGGPPNLDEESWHASTDLAFVSGPVAATAEAALRRSRIEGGPWQLAWGAFVQGGVFVWAERLELAARAGWMDPDADRDGDLVQVYELGANAYVSGEAFALGHHLKVQGRYALDREGGGTRHRGTLQVQAWF
jgi:hypothetical protein